jgi:hypothetical protein
VRVLLAFLAAPAAGIVVLVGLVFLVLPGIYLAVRLRLVVAAVMLGDCGPLEAFGRSFELTSGHGLTVFGVWLPTAVAGLVIGAAIALWTGGVTLAGGPDAAALEAAGRLTGAATAVLVTPVAVAADAVMYGLYGPDRVVTE